MKITNNRFICFLDIMGFKNLVDNNSHKVVLEKLKIIKDFTKRNVDGDDFFTNDDPENPLKKRKSKVRTISFSDSIILTTEGDSKSELDEILFKTTFLLWNCYHNQIPIKGALSYGELTMDYENSLFFGKPLINAYLLEEELLYYGVVLDYNIEKKARSYYPDSEEIPKCEKYKAPLKGGRIFHQCLRGFNGGKNPTDDNLKNLELLYNTVSGRPRIYVDNTIEYLKYVKNNT